MLVSTAAQTARTFYSNLEFADSLSDDWHLMTPELRTQFGSYRSWSAPYRDNVGAAANSVHITSLTGHTATLTVSARLKDLDACAHTVHRRYAGTWQLVRPGHKWRIVSIAMTQVAGRQLATDITQCDAELATPPAPPSDNSLPTIPSDPSIPSDTSAASFCDTHDCIPNFDNGRGYPVQCTDGMWSGSGGIQGACSGHGGER
jgi:hypothetical protein